MAEQKATEVPLTIHFPTGWRRRVCIWIISVVTLVLGGKVVGRG